MVAGGVAGIVVGAMVLLVLLSILAFVTVRSFLRRRRIEAEDKKEIGNRGTYSWASGALPEAVDQAEDEPTITLTRRTSLVTEEDSRRNSWSLLTQDKARTNPLWGQPDTAIQVDETVGHPTSCFGISRRSLPTSVL
eukprot:m.685062 g.685062  ORF g.685062 m.685062 type:complete len:137 (-) comp58618_c0_seq3:148-558(-)